MTDLELALTSKVTELGRSLWLSFGHSRSKAKAHVCALPLHLIVDVALMFGVSFEIALTFCSECICSVADGGALRSLGQGCEQTGRRGQHVVAPFGQSVRDVNKNAGGDSM